MLQILKSVLSALLAFLISSAGLSPVTASDKTPSGTFSDPDAYLSYRMNLAPDAVPVPFAYRNDPAENALTLVDAIVNPDAIFGFSPNPESVRLKDYVDAMDWGDPAQVAYARELRAEYHQSMTELYRIIEQMLSEAKSLEEIARAVSQRRNEIRLESYQDNPEGLALIIKSNLETYGNEFGPSPDSLYEKYGSWQTVLDKALGSNPGMDACLGFYDDYFELYEIPNP